MLEMAQTSLGSPRSASAEWQADDARIFPASIILALENSPRSVAFLQSSVIGPLLRAGRMCGACRLSAVLDFRLLACCGLRSSLCDRTLALAGLKYAIYRSKDAKKLLVSVHARYASE